MSKETKQGVRDLNPQGHTNPRRKPHPARACAHVWEVFRVYDCWDSEYKLTKRCGFCREVRR